MNDLAIVATCSCCDRPSDFCTCTEYPHPRKPECPGSSLRRETKGALEMSATLAASPSPAGATNKTRAGTSGHVPALTAEHHAEVRRRWVEFLSAHQDNPAVSQEKVGRLIGFSAGAVLSSWVRGKYTGDNDKVTRRVERYLDGYELRLAFGADGLEYAETTARLEIEQAIELAEATRGIARIVGVTGSGKSRALTMHELNADAMLLSGAYGMTTARAVISQIWAHRFGMNKPLSRKAPTTDAQQEVIALLTRTPHTLMVDEFDYASPLAAETLRCITDSARIPLVIAGEKWHSYSGAFEGRVVAEVSLDGSTFTQENVELVAHVRGLKPDVIAAVINDLVQEARNAGGFRRVRIVLQSAQSVAGRGQPIGAGHVLEAIRKLRRARGGGQ